MAEEFVPLPKAAEELVRGVLADHPDEKTIGKLCAHIQEEVEISIEPPEPGEGLIQNDGEEE